MKWEKKTPHKVKVHFAVSWNWVVEMTTNLKFIVKTAQTKMENVLRDAHNFEWHFDRIVLKFCIFFSRTYIYCFFSACIKFDSMEFLILTLNKWFCSLRLSCENMWKWFWLEKKQTFEFSEWTWVQSIPFQSDPFPYTCERERERDVLFHSNLYAETEFKTKSNKCIKALMKWYSTSRSKNLGVYLGLFG